MDHDRLFRKLEDILGAGILSKSKRKLEALFHCPNCEHKKHKLAVNLKTRKYHCWVCNLRGTDFLYLIKTRFPDSYDLISDIVNDKEGDYVFNDYIEEEIIEEKEEKVELPSTFMFFNNPIARRDLLYYEYVRYLTNRFVTKEDVDTLQLGFDSHSRRVVFPSYDIVGKLNYYVGRGIYDYVMPKYQNPPNDKTKIVFNEKLLEYDDGDIFLVEGVFDYIKFNYMDYNVLVTLGSELTDESSFLFNRIMSFGNIYLCYDRDATYKMCKFSKLVNQYGKKIFILDWKQKFLNNENNFYTDNNDLGALNKMVKNPMDLSFIEYDPDSHLRMLMSESY